MTPAARLQQISEILDALNNTAQPADRFLRDWFRVRRYAGSKDRAAVGEKLFEILRHRASLGWRMESETGRSLVIASLLAEGKDAADIETIFSGDKYALAPLTETERLLISTSRESEPPSHVRGEFSEFLTAELQEAFGERLLAEMSALAERAPVDLRVNRLKAKREAVLASFGESGFAAAPTQYSPDGIRIPAAPGLSSLSQNALFKDGSFVFQDEAAQIAALLCGAQPGHKILDIAAGAGGKSLALAAIMENRGEIVANDIRNEALRELERRAELAGATIIRTTPAPEGLFDIVFVDAPCSGSGTWRRQPENKWRLTPHRLTELNATQDELLHRAAGFTRPGGRILYATCSILPCENERRVEAFLASHPHFAVHPAREMWRTISESALPGAGDYWHGSPHSTGTDGFFCAILTRAS